MTELTNKRKFFKPAYVVYHMFDRDDDREGRFISQDDIYSVKMSNIKKFAKEHHAYTLPFEKFCISKDLKKIYKLRTLTNLWKIDFNENEIEWEARVSKYEDETIVDHKERACVLAALRSKSGTFKR